MQPVQDNRSWLGCIRDFTIASVKELYSRWQRQYNPTKTSFPTLPNSIYHCVTAESHVTIIDAVKQQALSYL